MATPVFLRSVTSAPLREDQMIINDVRCFGDWELIKEFKNNVAVFGNSGSRVSIMNVNRTPSETTLGVDLIYCNEMFSSYILVQYKRLTGSGREKKCRLDGDEHFSKELNRMTEAERLLEMKQNQDKNFHILGYRISQEAFYFKFCQDMQEIETKGLCAGMYLPKSYILRLIDLGWKSVSRESVDRHLNNTQFIENVKSGFFGSSGLTSQNISKLISEVLGSGKSIILASHFKA